MTVTRRQKEILDYITSYTAGRGYAPTLREICDRFSLSSVATAHKHLARLQEKGYLIREPNSSRGLKLRKPASGFGMVNEVPLMGQIAAGKPIESFSQAETISLPESMLGRGNTYVLRVRGDSMIDEHIKDGDYIIVEERNHAENGETVVALIGGDEATLKKYFREASRIRLQPANPALDPVYVSEEDLTIQGVVIGIMRKY